MCAAVVKDELNTLRDMGPPGRPLVWYSYLYSKWFYLPHAADNPEVCTRCDTTNLVIVVVKHHNNSSKKYNYNIYNNKHSRS